METNAILAVNSLDRYITNKPGQQNQPLGNALQQQYFLSIDPQDPNGDPQDFGLTAGPPCNNFSIVSPGALLYGYISKLVVAEIQINYNIPTIIPERNDTFWLIQGNVAAVIATKARITIPYGFYTPYEMAALLQALILQSDFGITCPNFTVTWGEISNDGVTLSNTGFIFNTNSGVVDVFFPSLSQLNYYYGTSLLPSSADWINGLKTYRTLGLSSLNSGIYSAGVYIGQPTQASSTNVNFLYTPYIDIISETLTKYQKVKDTDTSAQKQNSIISRLYLSGSGPPQYLTNGTTPDSAGILGARPFTVIQSSPNPKVIRWSKDEAINSIDFQLRDQYGDLIFTSVDNFPSIQGQYFFTEFQMTLLCTEGEI